MRPGLARHPVIALVVVHGQGETGVAVNDADVGQLAKCLGLQTR